MEEWLSKYPPEDKDRGLSAERNAGPPVSRKKLMKQPSQKSLDLHGLTAEQAGREVEQFLSESKRRGLKKVLIIHGKGYHSNGRPVLKKEVIKILERNSIAGEFGTADRKEGGSGAVWVLLK
ncbi:MAG: Smr/MutS family protein [Spirochaetales bacterium]|uniref:Smr/MutS family protein n=1 Tax=Candidatus Thalassospirochaeta sargassi TaxID=3119039 RepID=A0AAJ1MNE0_9SPIO|nr:Smr/MutS family protein [Spirochaetales bacterium]